MTVSVNLSPSPVLQFFDNTGRPCIGGSLQTQVGGINYPTYSDNAGTVPLPNPIPLNSRGEVSTAAGATSELFLQQGISYTFILKDSAGNQLWSVSNIIAPTSGQSINFPSVSGTANAIILTNANPVTVVAGTIQWFVPTASNTGAVTINDDNNGAVAVLYNRNALLGNEIGIGVPTQVIFEGFTWNLITSAKGPQADYYIDTGTVNAMIVASGNFVQNSNSTSDGLRVKVKAAQTTTAAGGTLTFTNNPNINGNINLSSAPTTSPPAGAIIAGNIYEFIFQANIWLLLNPSRVTGSFTATPTGLTTSPTCTVTYRADASFTNCTLVFGTGIVGTSNAAVFTLTGMPSFLTPVQTQAYYTTAEDSTSAASATIIFTAASSTITLGKSISIGAGINTWTTSGTKAFSNSTTSGQNIAVSFVLN